MKILVIGGSKFIGLAVTTALHRMGHDVAVFNRGQTETELPAGVQHIVGDVNQISDSAESLRAFAPEIVLHNIILHDQHVRDAQALFAGIARRFVMISSMDVYVQFGRIHGTESGDLVTGFSNEDSPVRSVLFPYRNAEMQPDHRLYNYDKIPAEKVALTQPDLPGVVLRLPMVIGERDWQRRTLPFVKPMQDGRKAIVLEEAYAKWYSTYGYVENVAHAMALAATDDRANGRIYNVADGAYTTLELGKLAADAMQWNGEFVVVPGDQLPASLKFDVAQVQDLKISAERIKKELDYAPLVPFEEGVRRAVAWEVAHPPAEYPPALTDYSAQDEVLQTLGYA